MKAFYILLASAIITGCATAAIDVKPIAADAAQYQHLDCDALYLQCVKTSGDLRASYAKQEAKASSDAAKMTANLLFLPVFWGTGDDENTATLAKLKGEYKAIYDEMQAKACKQEVQSIDSLLGEK